MSVVRTVSSNVYPAMKLLWDSSKQYQSQFYNLSVGTDKKWLNDACTIKIGSCRSAGHDFAIVNMAKEFGDIIHISPNINMLKSSEIYFKKNYIENGVHYFTHYNLEQANDLSNIDAIFVNCSSMMSATAIDKICNFAAFYVGFQRLKKQPFGLFLVQ